MGIKFIVKPYPNPNPYSPGNWNEMQMSWLGDYIKKISPVLPVFQIGVNCFTRIFLFILFRFLFLFSCFPSYSWSSGAFSQRPSPVEGEGNLFCVERTRLSDAPPQRRLPFWGPLALAQILPEEKRHSPERIARNPRKGPAGSSLSGWPQAPSGVPAVLFPFSWEDVHRFPLRVQAVSPYRRKTPRPMGS